MRRLFCSIPVLALSATTAFAQAPAVKTAAKPAAARQAATAKKEPLVEFDMMTWPEVKTALAAGKTTALVYTGGTEQRGPQNVNGGHTLMARATAKAIALKLGNAIVMPTLAYSPNRASAELPGTIGLSNEVFGQMLTEISEQAIITGFKNVIIMAITAAASRACSPRWPRSSTRSTRRKASTSTSAIASTPRRKATSTIGSSRTGTRAARMRASQIRRRCCTSAATRAGCERN